MAGQTKPWYVADLHPEPNSVEVPTNTTLLVHLVPTACAGGACSETRYRLTDAFGAAVALRRNYGNPEELRPEAPLQPSARYTLTIEPPSRLGETFSFSFVTGPGADTEGPRVVSFQPQPGTNGVSIYGPFTVALSERVTIRRAWEAVFVRGSRGAHTSAQVAIAPGGKGLIIKPSDAYALPFGFDVVVDASKLMDLAGNSGSGVAEAHYTTTLAADARGPVVKAHFPADGETNLPTDIAIVVLFEQEVDTASAAQKARVESDGKTVETDITSIFGGRGIALRPKVLLSSESKYRAVVDPGLRDAAGTQTPEAFSFEFTTNITPSLTPNTPADVFRQTVLPRNAVLGVRANRRIMPIVPAAITHVHVDQTPIPVTATLTEDGMALLIKPAGPLPPRSRVRLPEGDIVDLSGRPVLGFSEQDTGDAEDREPPRVLGVFPPGGAEGVPPNASITVLLNEPVGVWLTAEPLRLLRDGQPVKGEFGYVSMPNAVRLQPAAPLEPHTSYTVQVSGLTDLAGHSLADTSFAFTTGGNVPSPVAGKWVNSHPADRAIDVDPSTPIELTFDQDVDPLQPIVTDGLTTANGAALAFRSETAGKTVRIIPAAPLPYGAVITVHAWPRDLRGRQMPVFFSFTTARLDDPDAPHVQSVTPPDGGELDGRAPLISLTFDETVNPASVSADSFLLYGRHAGQTRVPAPATVAADGKSVILKPAAPLEGDYELVTAAGVSDLAGNALVPFRSRLTARLDKPLRPNPVSASQLLAAKPPDGATDVSASANIVLMFVEAVSAELAPSSVLVLADGMRVAGDFEVSHDSRVLQFRPQEPFPAGASVEVIALNGPYFRQGTMTRFTVDGWRPPSRATAVRHTSVVPANGVIDVEFSADVPVGRNLLRLVTGWNRTTEIPAAESKPRPRVIRLTPRSPLAVNQGYSIILAPEIAPPEQSSSHELGVQVVKSLQEKVPEIRTVAPVAESAAAPVNASIHISLDGAVNALSLNGDAVRVLNGERQIGGIVEHRKDGRALVFVPHELLPADSRIDVRVAGLDDPLGRTVQGREWSFTTGSHIDRTGPNIIVRSHPEQTSAVDLPATPTFRFVFDEPVAPGNLEVNTVGFEAVVLLDDDLREVTVVAATPVAIGREHRLGVGTVTDVAGNRGQSASVSFISGFYEDTTPPKLESLFPPDGWVDAPLNVVVSARFSEVMAGELPGIVRLFLGEEQIPLTVVGESNGREVLLAPKRPLESNRKYRIVVQGATDLHGNMMQEEVIHEFTTSDRADGSNGTAVVLHKTPLPPNAPLRIRLSEPLGFTSDGAFQLKKQDGAQAGPIPAEVDVSADRKLLTIGTPGGWADGQRYTLDLRDLRDAAGNVFYFGTNQYATVWFTGQTAADTQPPSIIVTPPSGITGVPANARIAATFSEPVDLERVEGPLIALYRDGAEVPGKIVIERQQVTFAPQRLLEPGTTYRVDVAAVTDLAGNTAGPSSATFSTGTLPFADYKQIGWLSSTPPHGSVGIPVDSNITVTFDEPVLPGSVTSGSFSVRSDIGGAVKGTYSVAGNSVTFTPAQPLIGGADIFVRLESRNQFFDSVQDLAGNPLGSSVAWQFRTAPVPDSVPPAVLSVWPEPGTALRPGPVTFRIAFSEPVRVPAGALQVFGGNERQTASLYYGDDPRTVVVTAAAPSNSKVTIAGSAAIVDAMGNGVERFSLEYPTLEAAPYSRPFIRMASPYPGQGDVKPDTPIQFEFDRKMDPPSVMSALRVTEDGKLISGKTEMTDENRGMLWTPDRPYAPGSRIDTFVLATAMDTFGQQLANRVWTSFIVAGSAQGTTPAVVNTTSSAGVPANLSVRLLFDTPLDPSSVNSDGVWLRSGNKVIPGRVTMDSERVVVFEPLEPLTPGLRYALAVGPLIRSREGKAAEAKEFPFTATAARDGDPAESRRIDIVQLPEGSAVRVRFDSPADPLEAANATLFGRDGRAIPVERRLGVDGLEWLLVPSPPVADLQGAGVRFRANETGQKY